MFQLICKILWKLIYSQLPVHLEETSRSRRPRYHTTLVTSFSQTHSNPWKFLPVVQHLFRPCCSKETSIEVEVLELQFGACFHKYTSITPIYLIEAQEVNTEYGSQTSLGQSQFTAHWQGSLIQLAVIFFGHILNDGQWVSSKIFSQSILRGTNKRSRVWITAASHRGTSS